MEGTGRDRGTTPGAMPSTWTTPRWPSPPTGPPNGRGDTVLLIRRVRLDPEQVSADPRSRRRRTLHPDQRALPIPELEAEPAIYAYSFILTNADVSTPAKAAACEHWYRHRTAVENIFRDSKHGAALRHLPSGYEQVNTAWMWASLIAAAVAAWLHHFTGLISGGELLEGHGTRGGKAMIATLRRTLIATPARLVRHGRQLIMRLAPGRTCCPPSSPRSAPCQPPASRSQHHPALTKPSPAPRPQATAPRPAPAKRPRPRNPARVPGYRHVLQPGLTTPRSSTGLRITSAALLVDSGQSGEALLAVHQEECALAAVRDDRAEEVRAVAGNVGPLMGRVPATQEPAR